MTSGESPRRICKSRKPATAVASRDIDVSDISNKISMYPYHVCATWGFSCRNCLLFKTQHSVEINGLLYKWGHTRISLYVLGYPKSTQIVCQKTAHDQRMPWQLDCTLPQSNMALENLDFHIFSPGTSFVHDGLVINMDFPLQCWIFGAAPCLYQVWPHLLWQKCSCQLSGEFQFPLNTRQNRGLWLKYVKYSHWQHETIPCKKLFLGILGLLNPNLSRVVFPICVETPKA